MSLSEAEELELLELEKEKALAESNKPDRSKETALKTGLDALAFGYTPQVVGAAKSVFGPQTYTEARDQYSKELAELSQENPKAALAGTLAGALGGTVATGGVLGALGLGARAAAGAGRAAKGVQALKGAAQAGAGYGAIQNPGDTEGEIEPLQLLDRARGAAVGAGLGAGGQVVGAGLQKGAQGLSRLSDRAAFKSLGPYAREAMKAHGKGDIEKIGAMAKKQGVVGGSPKSYGKMEKLAKSQIDKKGKELGSLYDELAEAEQKLLKAPVVAGQKASAGIDTNLIANELKDELLPTLQGVPGASKVAEKWVNMADEIAGQRLSFKDAQNLKKRIGDRINWDRLPGADIPDEEQFLRALYRKISQSTEDSAEAIAKLTGGESKLNQLVNLRDEYSKLKTIGNIVGKRESKEFANRLISPSDYGMGALGAGIGYAQGGNMEAMALGGIMGLANRGARRYGNQLTSSFANQMSRPAGAIGSALQSVPGAMTNIGLSQERMTSREKLLDDYSKIRDKKVVSPEDAKKMWENQK